MLNSIAFLVGLAASILTIVSVWIASISATVWVTWNLAKMVYADDAEFALIRRHRGRGGRPPK